MFSRRCIGPLARRRLVRGTIRDMAAGEIMLVDLACRVRGDTSQGAGALREGRCRGRVWRHADDVRGRAWHLDAASRLVELGISMRHLKEWVSSPRRGCLGFCFIIFTFTLYVHLYFLCLGLLSFAFCLMLHFTCCCPCFTFLLFTWPFSFHLLRLLQHTICILFSHPSYHYE